MSAEPASVKAGRGPARRVRRASSRWTPADDALLRHLWGETDTPSAVIAARLGRSVAAVSVRASSLGVPRGGERKPPARPIYLGHAVMAKRRAAEARQRREEAFRD